MTNVEKLKAYRAKVTDWVDEQLDEAVPKDMLKNMRSKRFLARAADDKGSTYLDQFPNADLAKSSIREITPKEAKEELANGNYKNIIYTFKKEDLVYSSSQNFTSLRDKDGIYLGSLRFNTDIYRDGKEINTKVLSASVLGKLADKIYFYDNVDKDPELMAFRAENPESPNFKPFDGNTPGYTYDDLGLRRDNFAGIGISAYGELSKINGKSKDSYKTGAYSDSIATLKQELEKAKADKQWYIDKGQDVPWSVERRISRVTANLQYALKTRQNNAAKIRYAASERDLKSKTTKYLDLKDELRTAQEEVQSSKTDLAAAKSGTSWESRYYRDRVENYKKQLANILRELARVEIALDNAQETDALNVEKFQKAVDEATAKADTIAAQIDDLLKAARKA